MEQIKPDKRYLLADKQNLNLNISLKTNFNDVNEFNNTRIISLSELFTKERNDSKNYRIYGNINYFSFLRNKKTNPSDITDVFNDDYLTNGFNLEDFFDLKILRLLPIQTYSGNTNTFVELLTSITNTNDYKLSFFGYNKNIYNEKNYNFKFESKFIDPNEIIKINVPPSLGRPGLLENYIFNNYVYLGFIPKPSNYYSLYEKVIDKDYVNTLNTGTTYGFNKTAFTSNINEIVNLININSNFSNNDFNKYFIDKLEIFFKIYNLSVDIENITRNLRFIRNYLDIGNGDYKTKSSLDTLNMSVFTGNSISFDKENYNFSEITKKEYLIKYQLIDTYEGDNTLYLNWKYNKGYTAFTYTETFLSSTNPLKVELKIDFWFKFNPFYKIELKKYDSLIDEIYSGTTTDLIPPQTAIVNNNRIIWKDLLLYGDPDNYDNPFINNNHYFFNDINFYLKPDLSDKNTFILINEFLLSFGSNNYNFNRENITIRPQGPKEIC
jgi:hypothetical protein